MKIRCRRGALMIPICIQLICGLGSALSAKGQDDSRPQGNQTTFRAEGLLPNRHFSEEVIRDFQIPSEHSFRSNFTTARLPFNPKRPIQPSETGSDWGEEMNVFAEPPWENDRQPTPLESRSPSAQVSSQPLQIPLSDGIHLEQDDGDIVPYPLDERRSDAKFSFEREPSMIVSQAPPNPEQVPRRLQLPYRNRDNQLPTPPAYFPEHQFSYPLNSVASRQTYQAATSHGGSYDQPYHEPYHESYQPSYYEGGVGVPFYDLGDQNPNHQSFDCGLECSPPVFYLSSFGMSSWLNEMVSGGNTLQPRTGGGFGFALGQRQGRNLRMELEYAHRIHGIDSLDNLFDPQGVTGKLRAQSGMANVWWEMVKFPRPCFKPYLGAGLGFVSIETNLADSTGFGLTQNRQRDSSFAYQFFGGVNYKAYRNMDLFVEYRLFRSDGFRIQAETAWGGGDYNYQTHQLMGGLRWKF